MKTLNILMLTALVATINLVAMEGSADIKEAADIVIPEKSDIVIPPVYVEESTEMPLVETTDMVITPSEEEIAVQEVKPVIPPVTTPATPETKKLEEMGAEKVDESTNMPPITMPEETMPAMPETAAPEAQ